jgi:hypothetical protein
VIDPNQEMRAYALLRWVPFSLPTEFDDELAMHGTYSVMQKKRSDTAFDQHDEKHPYKSSTELAAFRELERLGIYNQSDLYSPTKAKCGHYSERLKQQSDRSGSARHIGTSRSPQRNRRPRGWSYDRSS